MTRALSALGGLALVGCSVALAQTSTAAVTADPLAALVGTGGAAGSIGLVYVVREALKQAAEIGGHLKRGSDLVSDIKTQLAAQGDTLSNILVEQRASKAANEGNGTRLDRIEDELRDVRDHVRDLDDPTEERRRRRPKATAPA